MVLAKWVGVGIFVSWCIFILQPACYADHPTGFCVLAPNSFSEREIRNGLILAALKSIAVRSKAKITLKRMHESLRRDEEISDLMDRFGGTLTLADNTIRIEFVDTDMVIHPAYREAISPDGDEMVIPNSANLCVAIHLHPRFAPSTKSSALSSLLETIGKEISEIYASVALGDPRLVHRTILRDIPPRHPGYLRQFFLVAGKGWFAQLKEGNNDFFICIRSDGSHAEIPYDEFFIESIRQNNERLTYVFNHLVASKDARPFWSWASYTVAEVDEKRSDLQLESLSLQMKYKRHRRIDEIADELRKLDTLEKGLRPILLGQRKVPPEEISRNQALFLKAKQIIHERLTMAMAPADAFTVLLKMSEELPKYCFAVDPSLKGSLAMEERGNVKTILIHQRLWDHVQGMPNASTVVAQIMLAAILTGIEGQQSDSTLQWCEQIGGSALWDAQMAAHGSGIQPLSLPKMFRELSTEQNQLVATLASGDPSFLFISEIEGWRYQDRFFEKLASMDETQKGAQALGLKGAYDEMQNIIRERVGDFQRQEKFLSALDDLFLRLKILKAHVLTHPQDMDPATSAVGREGGVSPWVCFGNLDVRIRNKILQEPRYQEIQPAILCEVFAHLRTLPSVARMQDISELEGKPAYRDLELTPVLEAYRALPFKGAVHGAWYAGDYFNIAREHNIELIYDIELEHHEKIDADTLRKMRSEAMQVFVSGIKDLPQSLLWKLPKPIRIHITFLKFLPGMETLLIPRLLISHYVPGVAGSLDKIKLTAGGHPTGKQLKGLLTAMIHEILHKLALSKGVHKMPILPMEDFYALSEASGFPWFVEFSRPAYKGEEVTIRKRTMRNLANLEDRLSLSYKNHVWNHPDGRQISFVPWKLIDSQHPHAKALQKEGIDVQPDNARSHLYSSPEEVIAILGSETLDSLSKSLVDGVMPLPVEHIVQILQHNLLRSLRPVAQKADGTYVYEIYHPGGDDGFKTTYVDEDKREFRTLRAAISNVGPRGSELTNPSLAFTELAA